MWLAAWLSLAGTGARWEPQPSGTPVRLRGVSAVDARVAWASGDKGTFVRTTDGGRTWKAGVVPGADGLDFRDVDAFSASTAYVLSIGEGEKSRIYKTVDGGGHWTLQFTNPTPGAFFDGMAFWDEQHGIAFSDPVEGHFLLVATSDGGATWTPLSSEAWPPALPKEGGYAASGTSIAVQGSNDVWFGMGGPAARVLHSPDRGRTWTVAETPLATGDGGGVFSLLFWNARDGLAMGGNHRHPEDPTGNVALTHDGGRTWSAPSGTRPSGYRSCVAWLRGAPGTTLLAVGPSGSDVSTDGGATWTPLGPPGFHAVAAPRTGSTAWAVGEEGRIAKLRVTPPAAPRR
jgi:photosystem II stability/assembly factor-like uncharacterized protein